MKIKHKEWGEVDGVEDSGPGWMKSGAYYASYLGWSEVLDRPMVDVTSEIEIVRENGGSSYTRFKHDNMDVNMVSEYHFRKVRMWDLPEEGRPGWWDNLILANGVGWLKYKGSDINKFLNIYKRDCLIVEREGL